MRSELKAGRVLVLHHGVKAVNKPRAQIYETTDCRQAENQVIDGVSGCLWASGVRLFARSRYRLIPEN